MSGDEVSAVRMERVAYGGHGVGVGDDGAVVAVDFTLPGERVRPLPGGGVEILEASARRVEPGCPHFGVCGGCHLQMGSYAEQIAIKMDVLLRTLQARDVGPLPAVRAVPSPEAWGYRNRIRLHVVMEAGVVRLGYRQRGGEAVLAIRTCPIASPLLWAAAEALMARAGDVLRACQEVELLCDAEQTRLRVTFLRSAAGRPPFDARRFAAAMEAVAVGVPQMTSAGLARLDARSAQVRETMYAWGPEGIAYDVGGETFWLARGGFFQVNRLLLRRLVELVCDGREGAVAWDLYAGVGLFSRFLARRFRTVTAVEPGGVSFVALQASLARAGRQHRAVQATTLEFLASAVLDRERPELVVVDPPRAGLGRAVCALLQRIGAAEVVYVSCDPETLARDLAELAAMYDVVTVDMVDLFPQTFHQETVVALRRRSVSH